MKKILIIGQIPPPIHGQSLSTERLLAGHYTKMQLHFVEANYSKRVEEVGKFRLSKIIQLFPVIFKSLELRFLKGVRNLYYMPACSGRLPFYRDVFILISLRPFFKATLFHFRSAGIDEVYNTLFWFEKVLFNLAYRRPVLAIQLSELNPEDGKFIKAKSVEVVPNGILDVHKSYTVKRNLSESPMQILYIGSIQESKGVLDLLHSGKILLEKRERFIIHLVGGFRSDEFKLKLTKFIQKNGLTEVVKIHGKLSGDSKWEMFSKCHLLVFPTYYENESFGNVIIEAMQFELPVIATDWRAASSIVQSKSTGFIVPIKSPDLIAKKIQILMCDKNLRLKMGSNGRKAFLKNYSIEAFWRNMENVLSKASV
ncbi:glycosyltransferase [Rhodohalobacter sp. SW132]|uniref:glycosyltransferase family 4 protein n=1 Tax=Rhodohalobacter sp. SW132 TaxID=2293433 RepID=UPI000E27ADBB|nr:glycosyltransferase family 4 protein [Rhodohalobacter sp. SW132]REL37538.1 glycosyltransferase [Rhodohalobacter sp. SW132]